MLTLTSSSLRGMVGQKRISCTIRKSSPGLRIPPGNYALVPGPGNPIHGPVLLLLPADQKTARDLETESLELVKSIFKFEPSIGATIKICAPGTPAAGGNCICIDKAGPGRNYTIKGIDAPSHKSSTQKYNHGGLPVAAKSISGSPSFIVDQGFSDLLEVVSGSAGIAVRIS